jgi:hypothetical protein
MNLEHFNLGQYGVPQNDDEIQITVFLIASDLRNWKLLNEFVNSGCDRRFRISELYDLVRTMTGFDDRPNEFHNLYFDLLSQHCDKVTHQNDLPIREAFRIYKMLKNE